METFSEGRWCSDLNVYPTNWLTGGPGTVKKNWYISYYFHDPAFKDHPKYKYGKFCIVKGMNKVKDLKQRREVTTAILEQELEMLRTGYNPITGVRPGEHANEHEETGQVGKELNQKTPFKAALREALKTVELEESTKTDIKNTLTYIDQSIDSLTVEIDGKRRQMQEMPIGEISKRHIRRILDNCGNLTRPDGKKKKWNTNQFNVYKKYLSILFNELEELQAVDDNPASGIKKKKGVKRLRETLTDSERAKIDKYLRERYPSFWRFVHIFFHSGSRETEIMSLQGKSVDLNNQIFIILVKKGDEYTEAVRPIKNSVLPLWEKVMAACGPDDYLFSVGLVPGPKRIRTDQITKRWYRLVKKPLKITADFYCLKHMNLDETAAILNIKEAQKAAGHTSEKTTEIYTINEQARRLRRIKGVENDFAVAQLAEHI